MTNNSVIRLIRKKKFATYDDAVAWVRSNGITTQKQWRETERPDNIPAAPDRIYRDEWTTWGDFFGTDKVANQNRTFVTYDEVVAWVRSNGITTLNQWRETERPDNIPAVPERIYRNEWTSWGDFLGTGKVANQNRTFVSYGEAAAWARANGITTQSLWREADRPDNIPALPSKIYRDEWTTWGDFFGTDKVANQNRTFVTYDEVVAWVRSNGITTLNQWRETERPDNIPAAPDRIYRDEWTSWGDFLGTGRVANQMIRDKAIRILMSLNESDLESFTSLELHLLVNCGAYLKDLECLAETDEYTESRLNGIKELRRILQIETDNNPSSENDDPCPSEGYGQQTPDTQDSESQENFIGSETEQDSTAYGRVRLPQLSIADEISAIDKVSSVIPEETLVALAQGSKNRAWMRVLTLDLEDQKDGGDRVTPEITRLRNREGARYFNLVREMFMEEYEEVVRITPSPGYSHHRPNLMQKLCMYLVAKHRTYGNWSGTGAGKTISFILTSRHIDARLTVVLVPNARVEETVSEIKRCFPDSRCHTELEPAVVYDRKYHNYLVINYEKLQQPNAESKVKNLTDLNQVDFFVLDEVHLVKQREDDVSIRRGTAMMLRHLSNLRNPSLHVLAMSATPIINNLKEMVSVLEITTGTNYSNGPLAIDTRKLRTSAIEMHKHVVLNGIRFMPSYSISVNQLTGGNMSNLSIDGGSLVTYLLDLPTGNYAALEKVILQPKLDAIRQYLRKGVVIYTTLTTGIIKPVRDLCLQMGLTVGVYTGDGRMSADREDQLERFKKGQLDVLIGSDPIATGVDGLQTVCDRMICLTLPWTSAMYQQLIGRINRQGSRFARVEVIIPQVKITLEDGTVWSWDEQRLALINNKKTLSDTVMDGVVPSTMIPSPGTLMSRSIEALRSMKNQPMLFTGRPAITTDLYPGIKDEEEITRRTNSELQEFHRRAKTTKSTTLHRELAENPERWRRYHDLRISSMQSWDEDPSDFITTKITDPSDVVVDFGCGVNPLPRRITNKVIPLDHIAVDDSVTACNMRETPLEDAIADVAVFCLSISWGTDDDRIQYFKEAHRILKRKGFLYLAEPSDKYDDRDRTELLKTLESCGFVKVGDIDDRGKFFHLTAVKI